MNVIDLFAGAGGLSLGFVKDGYTIKKAVEFDSNIANTYKMNHPEVSVIVDDIKNIDKTDVFQKGDADVIIGGPPCQAYSTIGRANNKAKKSTDKRIYLYKH